ncbi:hypothetical protein KC19_VG193800 [Ceratodon purpureus]|uniref:Uncharacterized protein n=1 Tax=Ceratodon purpureus TaxID=3225 RepID=A0A8T0HS94_CERPU|nr:hypothetical protein KC19_VG193800 [Ceratodon purpureus]KAG0573615.1 hypothetical protein KC19_VG193800 [Ceratodon purpureus]
MVAISGIQTSSFLCKLGSLGTSWKMGNPIALHRLRLTPIWSLTCVELHALRRAQENPMNIGIELEEGETLSPAADIWVTPYKRS